MNKVNHSKETEAVWYLYVLDCDGRLYTGITTDVERRLAEHRSGRARAARFTRGARSIGLRYEVALVGKSEALRAEARFRRLRRPLKITLIGENPKREALLAHLGLAPE